MYLGNRLSFRGCWAFAIGVIVAANVLDAALPRRLTFLSTVTKEGKALPPVSADQPTYVVIASGAYHETGWPGVKNNLTRDDLDGSVVATLRQSGYLLADEAHPPTLALTYHWGTHNLPDMSHADYLAMQKNVLEKAALIGGKDFASQLGRAINEAAMNNLTLEQGRSGYGNRAAIGVARAFGENDPVSRFRDRSEKNRFLVDQAMSDCFFVVISAVAVGAPAGQKPALAWRTVATVRADSMSPRQAIPMLIGAAGPYLGISMKEAETLEKPVEKPAR